MNRCLAVLFALALVASCQPGPSRAQTVFPTPDNRTAAPGSVSMCLNGSSQAVPCSGASPLPVSGTFSASGTSANNADNVAPVGTGLTGSTSYNYVFDGTNWDRWTGAVTQGGTWNIGTVTAVTAISNALPAGGNTIGAVTQASGPWTTNQTQLNGATVLVGNGIAGVGSQRVTIVSDNTIPTGWPTAANQTSVIGTLAAGTSATNSLLTGVVFSSTPPALTNGQQVAAQSDPTGALFVNGEGRKTTYSVGFLNTPAASATDIACIVGSATKTVRLVRWIASGTATAQAVADLILIKRSTANSGGTSAAQTPVPHDSTNAAGTATVNSYSANPTPGATVGNIDARKFVLTTAGGTSPTSHTVIEWGTTNSQAVVLRGTSQQLCANLNTVTFAGANISIVITWTEE